MQAWRLRVDCSEHEAVDRERQRLLAAAESCIRQHRKNKDKYLYVGHCKLKLCQHPEPACLSVSLYSNTCRGKMPRALAHR